MASAAQPLEEALGNFVAMTAKSTVAVVVPLYGYWNDVPDNPVNGEVLSAVLRRAYSHIHHLIFIFVADPKSLEHDPENPESTGNILLARAQAGNVMNVAVPRNASYGEYVNEGLLAATEDTKAQFVVVLNPWVLLQDGALDVLIDRANYGDNAKVVSGFDMRQLTTPESFDTFKSSMPVEQYDVSLDFLGMPRYVAEMLRLGDFKTHKFVERDIWQQMSSKGFSVIASQRVPIFPFDFPWATFERQTDHADDEIMFGKKWSFNPGIKYGEE